MVSLCVDFDGDVESCRSLMGSLNDPSLAGVCCDNFEHDLVQSSSAFFLSHGHTDHMNGLDSQQVKFDFCYLSSIDYQEADFEQIVLLHLWRVTIFFQNPLGLQNNSFHSHPSEDSFYYLS